MTTTCLVPRPLAMRPASWLLCGMVWWAVSRSATALELAELATCRVVTAADAAPAVLYAAEEFRRHLTLASPPDVAAGSDAERATVWIGPGTEFDASPLRFSTAELGQEGYRIVARDGQLAIVGGSPRGTLYGVYAFLEDSLGVRFLTHDHTHVPRLVAGQRLESLDVAYAPPLRFRWSFYEENMRRPEFGVRLRNNTLTDDPRLGGKTGLTLINHTMEQLVPKDRYGAEHPEYFALIDGARPLDAYGGPQPCTTHPAVRDLVIRGALAQLAAEPWRENVSVSQNDNQAYCRCERCAAIDQREESPMGSLLELVNAAADAVAERHSGVAVGTLAYQYTRRPPAHLKPRGNVQIQLCSIECSMLHPINDPACGKNAAFCRDLEGWSQISDNVMIWNYNTNFADYLLPCPNLRVIEPNVRFFVARGAQGIFMQAAYGTFSAEFSDLRNYVISQLLWNPQRSGAELIDEFLTLHYGPAAPPIREFLEYTHDRAEASGLETACFGRAADYAVDAETARVGLDAFRRARELATDDVLRARVDKASICAYRAALEPAWYVERRDQLDPHVWESLRPIATRFLELCAAHEVTRPSEHSAMEPLRERLTRVFELAGD